MEAQIVCFLHAQPPRNDRPRKRCCKPFFRTLKEKRISSASPKIGMHDAWIMNSINMTGEGAYTRYTQMVHDAAPVSVRNPYETYHGYIILHNITLSTVNSSRCIANTRANTFPDSVTFHDSPANLIKHYSLSLALLHKHENGEQLCDQSY
jgi:hypothetical protein